MADTFVSPATLATIAVGAVISVVYLRYMWLALRRASETLDAPDDGEGDAFTYSFAGAIGAVVASSLAIALYGAGPGFLYIGVVLALASPVAVAYTFHRELNG